MTGEAPYTRDTLRRMTAPGLLCAHARATPGRVAFRTKHLGLYRERTFQTYALEVSLVAKALTALGLRRGDRVAIMGDVCEEWLFCDLAAQALGAIVYGIYPTASAAEVEYQLRDGGACIFIAEDQEYVDKILPFADEIEDLRHIVVIDDTAMFDYAHPKLRSYETLLAAQTADLDWLEMRVAEVPPEAPAFIVYTSGTTGHPKGALIAHGKHLAATLSVVETYPMLREREQRTVVYLPLCHVLGRDVAVTLPLISRLVPHFGEDPEDIARTLFETAPTVLFTVPRYLQKFASQILVGITNTSSVKKRSYEAAMRAARRHVRRLWDGTATTADHIIYRLWHTAVLRPILNKIGFDQLELVVSGGAPLPAETMALWQMYGINTVEMYGQTETAGGIIAGQRGPFPRPGNVGVAPDGWEVKLDADGEILVHCGDLFEGYWNNDAATAALRADDGFWRTGDVGAWQDGNLRLVDRARDFLVTSGGKTISPSVIENAVRASPYVAEVIVFGHGRKYLTALIEIDYDTVADWARNRNITYTGFTSLASHPQIKMLLRGEIDRANADLARVEQIKLFRILPKALDPEEEGEPVTPTRKVKRAQMYERFRALVEDMYDESESRMLSQEVGDVLQTEQPS